MDGIMTDKTILEEAKERFAKTLERYSEEYDRGEEDVNFLFDQWPEAERKRRAEQGRPCLQECRLTPFVDRIVNSAREMRPSVKVSPVDDVADPDTASVFKGLIRNIERQSKADIAYDTAMQYAVSAGYGWIRINTAYADPMSFDQEARIESVPDWKSVMLDPNSVEPDGSDAEYGFIYSDIDKEVFEEQYPDASPVNFETETNEGWCTEDTVRIVEYFYKKYTDVNIYECFFDGTVKILTEEQKKLAEEQGFILNVLRERTTKTHVVKWCKLSGEQELESTEWLSKYIPLVPVYGKLFWKDGRLKSYSLITHAKDPQRVFNIIRTTIAETVASQPKTQPYVGAKGQFNSYASDWANANRDNPAFLQYDPVMITDEVTGQSVLSPPPQKALPMQISPALMQMEQGAAFGINATLGIYDENQGEESNAISGIAIRSRQVRGDRATFHFIDNLACSIRHVGVILVDLIPKLYTKETIARIIENDGKEKNVTINPEYQGKGDKTQGIYNLGAGKYDVDVDVGPSYATQSQEFLDLSKELIRISPEYAAIAGDKIIEAVGGPHAEVIAERIRANMPPEIQSDDPMAAKLLQVMNQLKQSQDENMTLMASLEDKKKNEEFANQIDAGKLKIEQDKVKIQLMETMAKIEQMKMEAQGVQSEALADIVDAMTEIGAMVQDQNATLEFILSQEEGKVTSRPEQA